MRVTLVYIDKTKAFYDNWSIKMDNIIHNRLTRLILEKHAIKGCKRPFYVNIPSGVPTPAWNAFFWMTFCLRGKNVNFEVWFKNICNWFYFSFYNLEHLSVNSYLTTCILMLNVVFQICDLDVTANYYSNSIWYLCRFKVNTACYFSSFRAIIQYLGSIKFGTKYSRVD